jgi:hypothetical protein
MNVNVLTWTEIDGAVACNVCMFFFTVCDVTCCLQADLWFPEWHRRQEGGWQSVTSTV